MAFTYLRSKLQVFIPTCQTTFICSSNNNNFVLSYKGLSQRFIDRFLSQVNLRTLSSNIDSIQKPTLVPDLLNLRWVVLTNQEGFLKKTLAPILLYTSSRASEEDEEKVPLMRFSSSFSLTPPIKENATLVILASLALIGLRYLRVEKIPYSNRNHLVLSNHPLRSKWRDFVMKWMKKLYKGEALPPNSEKSIRVQTVMVKLLEALNDGLRLENASSLKFSGDDEELVIKIGDKRLRENMMTTAREPSKIRYGIEHLEKVKWEVLVVADSNVNAGFRPSGNVVVCSGLLDKFKDQAELATILAHEIGHGIARHKNEVSLSTWLVTLITLSLLFEDMPHYQMLLILLVRNFLSRRREMEADYIGLMLMASAGYDPRLAPEVFTKLNSSKSDFLSTHPTGTKRREKLQDPKVMGKAVDIYREVKEGLGLRSFI